MHYHLATLLFVVSTGSYAFMEASAPRKPGDVAQLINSRIKLSSPGCLTFWYHMYGLSIGTLAVYDSSSGTPKLLWSQTGDKKDKWFNARVSD